jgi:protein-tyrosine phosphatase
MATVLFVCTGNICRSPMAEAVLRALLAARGVEGVRVGSAGTWPREGAAPVPETVEALAERGYGLEGHVARQLTAPMVEEADLVLAMAAEHRDDVLRLSPAALPKTFTLREFVSLLDRVREPVEGGPGERLRAAAARAHALRSSGEVRVGEEDVADPLGFPLDTYRATLWDVEDLVERMVDALFGPPPGQGRVPAGEGPRARGADEG